MSIRPIFTSKYLLEVTPPRKRQKCNTQIDSSINLARDAGQSALTPNRIAAIEPTGHR